MADPLNERDLDNRHSIADIEKMLFESKLSGHTIHRGHKKRAAARVSLDPIKKLKTELSIPRDMRRELSGSKNTIPARRVERRAQ